MISLHTSVLQIVDESPCRTNIKPTHSLLPYHFIIMQGPTDDEACSVPTTYVFDSRILGVAMRRKKGKRTYPWPTAEDRNPALPPLLPPLPAPARYHYHEKKKMKASLPQKGQGCKHQRLSLLQQMEPRLIRPTIRPQSPS